MRVARVYEMLLRLYPVECWAWCAPEMLSAFEGAWEERRGSVGWVALEFAGVIWGAAEAWVAKLGSSKFMRGFWVPTTMRPAGKTWAEFYPPGARVLADVVELQRSGRR